MPNKNRRQMMQREACGRPAVLVVEDEILFRWTTVSVIDETGFSAVEAGSAVEAISILETRSDVWAVVTDVQMPGSIDGLKLAHLISIRWPKVKIIVTSGQVRLRDDDMPAGGRYLHKPYDPSHLIGILEEWVANE
ncbi:CheY-like chemotaxis protein [Bradyrhizobium sp. S3.9.2]|uniref:response regulator n=1 Tax=Bradyrhizobium TaxID=374 RepID=UPI001FD90274|nr:response regulator [Bradyrhizobium japonicum]